MESDVEPSLKSPPLSAPVAEAPQKNRRTIPFHPVLLALYPVMALLSRNFTQTPIQQSLRTFGIAAAVGMGLWAVILIFVHNLRKAAILASTAILLVFTYGHILNLTPESVHPIVGPICVLLLIAVAAATIKTRQPLFDTTAALNLMAFTLTGMSAYTIVDQARHHHPQIVRAGAGAPVAAVAGVHRKLGVPEKKAPDVYYIVLDAYGRADRLQQFFGYDNSAFIAELKKRGFYVAENSGANYDQTPLCLSSCLSMAYLDAKSMDLSPEGLRKLTDDSAVAQILQDHGRHYINVWSGLEVSRVETAETVLNNNADLNAFEKQALEMSVMVRSKKIQHSLYDTHRTRINGVFDCLTKAAELPGPKFVFAHALSPHPPFVFGPSGESVDPAGTYSLADGSWLLANISQQDYIRGYTGQLQYVNKRVLQAIDSILAKSKVRPIIILQGDHGSRMTVDWDSQKRTDLREAFSIFNAYLVPDSVREKLYPTISPVNSFRVVLSTLFDVKLPLLKDKSYYSTAEHMDRFSDVTDLIPNATGPEEKAEHATPGNAALDAATHGIH